MFLTNVLIVLMHDYKIFISVLHILLVKIKKRKKTQILKFKEKK